MSASAADGLPVMALPALHRSVDDGSLELLYQPEVELDSGALVAMEGLLRWHHGDLGVLTPTAFLDVAERSGDSIALGQWVLREGVAEARRWRSLPGPARRLWLNLSRAQLLAPDLPDVVAAALADRGLPADALGPEVAEPTVRQLGWSAGPLLQSLRETGVALAVDDVSRHDALDLLAGLPVDVVKLGQRYTRGCGEAAVEDLADDVARLVDRAHRAGLTVVAEGVETWAEAALLSELGCDRAHGWLFASPQRADRARWLLARGAGWRGALVTPSTRARPFVPSPRTSL